MPRTDVPTSPALELGGLPANRQASDLGASPASGRVRTRWPAWVPYAAATWSFAVAGLALFCTVTGSGYPLATDPEQSASIFAGLSAEVGSVLLLGASLLAGALSLTAARGQTLGSANQVAVAALVLIAVPLLFVVPDNNLLVMLGYTPMFLVGATFGWPPVSYFDSVTWPLLFQLISVLGGLLLAGTALAWRRRAARSCLSCGRSAVPARWTTPESAAIWGRWAVLVAVVPPLMYALDRWAWAAGIPLGISQNFLDEMHRTGLVWAGFRLGTFAFLDAVLTLGLVQRWGEVFPRWMVGLAARGCRKCWPWCRRRWWRIVSAPDTPPADPSEGRPVSNLLVPGVLHSADLVDGGRVLRSQNRPRIGRTSGMNPYPRPKTDHTVSSGKASRSRRLSVPTTSTPMSSTDTATTAARHQARPTRTRATVASTYTTPAKPDSR